MPRIFFFSIISLHPQPTKSITSPPSTQPKGPKPTLNSSFSQDPTKRCRERYVKIQYGSNSFVENALYTSSSASFKSQRLFFFFKNKVRIFFFFFFFFKAEINQLLTLISFLCELISNLSDIDQLCCSNLDLVLCLKLIWKIKRRRNLGGFLFIFLFFFTFIFVWYVSNCGHSGLFWWILAEIKWS